MTHTTIRFTPRQGWQEAWRKKHQQRQATLIRLGLKTEDE
jgi:hypothetical protein